MRPPKINDHKLLRLIDRQKMTQTKAAKELGVSRQAVSRRLQEIRGKTTRVIVAKKVEQVIDRKIDAMDQLIRINEYTNEILDLVMAWGRGDDEALQALESQIKNKKVRVGNEKIGVPEFKLKDPREIALKACGEIRNQIKLQVEIFQALYSLQEVEEFQKTIVEVLGEVSPEMRDRFVQKLKARPSVRAALRYS
jgi:predicted transcriptional regulator